jgi:hypothetical protein
LWHFVGYLSHSIIPCAGGQLLYIGFDLVDKVLPVTAWEGIHWGCVMTQETEQLALCQGICQGSCGEGDWPGVHTFKLLMYILVRRRKLRKFSVVMVQTGRLYNEQIWRFFFLCFYAFHPATWYCTAYEAS